MTDQFNTVPATSEYSQTQIASAPVRSRVWLWLAVIISWIVIGGGMFWLGTYFTQNNYLAETTPGVVIDPYASASPTVLSTEPLPSAPPDPAPWPTSGKRLYPADFLFFGQPLPTEMTSLRDDQLLSLDCSPYYTKQIDGSYRYFDLETAQLTEQSGETVYIQAETIKKALGGSFADTFAICSTDNNQKLAIIHIYQGGGGVGNRVELGFLSSDDTSIGPLAKITNEKGGPYFACHYPFLMTTNNVAYMNCGAGDAGYGAGSIVKVDLNTESVARIKSCSSNNVDQNSFTQEGVVECDP